MNTFTERQKSILIGSMLGDGTLEKHTNTKRSNSRFREVHGIEQLEWLKWKAKALESIYTNLRCGESVARKNLGNGVVVNDYTRKYKNCILDTSRDSYFTALEKEWYQRDEFGNYVYKKHGKRWKRIKVLPQNLILDKLALSIWYLDDGSTYSHGNGCAIFTLDFSFEEVNRLVEILKSFGFADCKVIKYHKEKEQYYIHIGTESYLDFVNMVKEQILDIPECVIHKVDSTKKTRANLSNIGIPNFSKNKNNIYAGFIIIKGQSINLGRYNNEETAKKVSEEINILRKSKCEDIKKYEEIVSKFYEKEDKPKSFRKRIINRKKQSNLPTGVTWCKKYNRYYANITVNGRSKFLGSFKTIEEAEKVRKQAEQELWNLT